MRLEFNILWVDDQPKGVESTRVGLEVRLRKQGFKLQTQFATSVEEAKKFLASDVYGDHIDLVLMDYDLGGGPKGDVGLTEVRQLFPYKDIVFYSGEVPALQKAVAEGNVPGVFCSSRKELLDTIVGVFETLVKKVLDIDHSRGIVMGTTSEIDHFVNESLLNAYANGNDDLRTTALKVVKRHLKSIKEAFAEEAAKVEAATDVSVLLEMHQVYSSKYRLRLLLNILKTQGSHVDERVQMTSYAEKTMPRRNELAHIHVKKSGFSRKIYRRNGDEVTEVTIEDMQELRVALLDHHELFEKIAASLQPKDSP